MSNIDKIAKINLENKPYVKPVSNVDIGFYNLDNGTAKLQFVITRDGFPMQIGPVNVTGYLWLKSTNGTMSGQLDLEIIDGLNGIVGVTIPNWFLVGSTDTDVKGQIILAVNENTDIATLGEFGFRVKDALPNQIKGEIKVQYFRMFDDMKIALENKVQDIETRLGDLDLLITNVETTVSNGISQVNTTVKNAEDTLNNIKTQASTDIETTSKKAISDVNTAKTSAISTMDSKTSEKVSEVESMSNDVIKHVDDKLNEFNTGIEENGFVQPDDLNNKLNELTWQKYKFVNDDGRTFYMTGKDWNNTEFLDSLLPGHYYITVSTNSPEGVSYNGFITVFHRDNAFSKMIEYRPYNSPRRFIKYFNKTWSSWMEAGLPVDTGWIPFQLINGALSNTAYKSTGDGGFDCAYRTITNGSETKRLLRLNGSNLTQGQVVGQLPSNFCKNAQTFPIRVPTSTEWFGAYIVIRPNGEVRFYISGNSTNWNEAGYMYGEIEWHD